MSRRQLRLPCHTLALLAITELANSMTRLTMHRMESLLGTMFKATEAPVSKYSDLESSYSEYVEARTTLQRHSKNRLFAILTTPFFWK